MNSLRRWLYRPKRSDSSLLAQFYFADEDLNLVAAELDSFEGRKDPERCTSLVNQLRACQARVLNVVSQMMDEQVKDFRASRDFRVKFPDDVIQENLAGQLWFGAECLAAGSSIMNREVESACMRPLARALTKNLDSLRNILREQCLRSIHDYTETIKESLIIFDKLFAEFELSYVSAMVPVKTAHEYDLVQEITVLFSETVQRALKIGLLTRDIIDEYDPALMFTIPRLAIVSGVHIFRDGPLNPDNDPWNLSEMFRPFQTLLLKIRELLDILTDEELNTLERALCSQEEPSFLISLEEKKRQNAREERRKSREERKYKSTTGKKRKDKEESDDGSMENELTALEIAERLEALALNFETSRNAKLVHSNELSDHETGNKSSESSSSSSSSFQSEIEAEEAHAADVERVNGSEHTNDVQVQHFTNQLYYEANLDSHSLTLNITVVDHHSAFSPEFVDPPVHNSASETAEDSPSNTKNSVSSNSQDNNNINASLETAAVGRAHFAMNKCDSNDSGLHSEVLSNSDSTFTISSSDSNQHMPISDIPGASECHQDDCDDPSHCTDDQAVKNHNSAIVVEQTPTIGNSDNASIVSRTSSDTLVSDSEVKNSCIQACLNSPSGCKDGPKTTNNSEEGTVAHEQHKVVTADGATKQADSTSRQAHETDSSLYSEQVQTGATKQADSTIRQAHETDSSLYSEQVQTQCLAQPFEGLSGHLILASLTEDGINNSSGHVNKNQDSSQDYKVNDFESTTSEKTTSAFSCGDDKSSLEAQEQLPGSSNAVIEKSGFKHSKNSHSVVDNVCDNTSPDHGGVCVNLCVGAALEGRGDPSPEDIVLNCANSDAFTSESFHSHPTVPPSAVSEDRENNNDVKRNSTLNENSDVHFHGDKESVQPEVLQNDAEKDSEDALQMGTRETLTESSSDIISVISHSPSISATNTEASSSITSVKTSDLSYLLPSTIDETQNSGKLTSNSQAHPSQNGLHNHTSTTNTSNPPSSGPETSSVKNGYRGIKGSSKARSFKKSSKIRRQPQDTSSSIGQRSGLPGQAKALMESQLLDSECNHSSETSSYNSDCGDQEEIDLAIKAAENATRQQVRARFQSNSDMIHRLFVCISGVADQLQTNFAGDLRNILRAVFDMNCSQPVDITTEDKCKDTTPLEAAYRAMSHASRTARRARNSSNQKPEPPSWVPDEQSNECMSCQVPFTFVRRRHHCRNCGKIFCSRCSSNFVPLPHFGQDKAVRVCNRCYMFQVTPFTVRPTSQ